MEPSAWLNAYYYRQWLTFNEFLEWQQSCTCPVGTKTYSCKHSVGLGILFNLYE
ncbi:unnamed protein product, partial [Rotaria sp. Silwood2]